MLVKLLYKRLVSRHHHSCQHLVFKIQEIGCQVEMTNGLKMKSSDAKASKCHLKFCSRMTIFINLVYLSSVISLK